MEKFEKVEKIVEKTGVSYEMAKDALEKCNEDMLDAIVYLEKEGFIKEPQAASYSEDTKQAAQEGEFEQAQASYEEACGKDRFKDGMDRLIEGCKKLLMAGMDNNFIISKKDEELAKIPVLILVLLLVFLFWVTLPLMVVGLFFDFRYSFQGIGDINVNINDACDKASEFCSGIKDDVVKATNKE